MLAIVVWGEASGHCTSHTHLLQLQHQPVSTSLPLAVLGQWPDDQLHLDLAYLDKEKGT